MVSDQNCEACRADGYCSRPEGCIYQQQPTELDRLRAALAEAERESLEFCSAMRRWSERCVRAETALAAAREVIEPFARAALIVNRDWNWKDSTMIDNRYGTEITFGHLRRAHAFLERTATAVSQGTAPSTDIAK